MLRSGIFLFAVIVLSGNPAARETETVPQQFTTYPAFRNNSGRVEAVTDKGLMKEYIIGCSSGVGIITFSKFEGLYCTPDHRCSGGLRSAIERLC